VFAEIATVVWICCIVGVFELARPYDFHGKTKLLRERKGFLELAPWQAGRIRNGGERFFAQNVVGDVGEKNRIYTAGIRDEARAVTGNQLAELFVFIQYHSLKLAFLWEDVEGTSEPAEPWKGPLAASQSPNEAQMSAEG
jgi:hypothetical protein